MIDGWLTGLEQRHLADLTFSEVARALRALSSTYVERRDRLTRKSAFDTAGKRAAYALYYSPLHFLTVAEIVRALQLQSRAVRHILDLGCGAGAAGAAWATQLAAPPDVTGVDAHPWALSEAMYTYRYFGLRGDTRRDDVARTHVPRNVDAIVAGWMLNEISERARDHVQRELLRAAAHGATLLVIEPIATRVSPWWHDWARTFQHAGGRADEWRFRVPLPDVITRFDRAAGLRHDEITARSLLLEGASHRKRSFDGGEE
jgi:SAM-dependent methyltransferase